MNPENSLRPEGRMNPENSLRPEGKMRPENSLSPEDKMNLEKGLNSEGKMSPEKKKELDQICLGFRKTLIETLHDIQTGHPGGSLSVMEILADLYFAEADISPENFDSPERDKVILCKGHAAPAIYLCLAKKGFFAEEEFKTLRQLGSILQGHPCSRETPGVEVSTGPLGAGYPAALGIALADQLDGRTSWTYAILGDGEIQEGVVWETAENAAKFHADHLITIVDWNGVQLDGTNEEIMPLGDLPGKWKAFGYDVLECSGHDVSALSAAIAQAKSHTGVPTVILAHTVKGKGISFMEGKNTWHGKAIDDESYKKAMAELDAAGENAAKENTAKENAAKDRSAESAAAKGCIPVQAAGGPAIQAEVR